MGMPLQDLTKTIRKFLKDFPKLNELKGLEESSDSDLAMYAMMALDDYNLTPPLIASSTFEAFPSNSLLIVGTLFNCLSSNALLQDRNSISYQDGGQNVNVWDKGPIYSRHAQFFGQLWEAKKTALKRAINISNGYGIIQSADFNLYNYMAMYGGDYIVSTTGTAMGESPMPLSYPGNMPIAGDGSVVVKLKTKTITFLASDFAPDADPNYYCLHFYHNLLCREVNVILEDPISLEDLSSRIRVFRVSENQIILKVPTSPDGRINGLVQCSIP